MAQGDDEECVIFNVFKPIRDVISFFFFFFSVHSLLLYASNSLSIDWEKLVGKKDGSFDEYELLDDWNENNIKKEQYHFITGSSYTGEWNTLGLNGYGNYIMPHGIII